MASLAQSYTQPAKGARIRETLKSEGERSEGATHNAVKQSKPQTKGAALRHLNKRSHEHVGRFPPGEVSVLASAEPRD
jgi:hypothetical protein